MCTSLHAFITKVKIFTRIVALETIIQCYKDIRNRRFCPTRALRYSPEREQCSSMCGSVRVKQNYSCVTKYSITELIMYHGICDLLPYAEDLTKISASNGYADGHWGSYYANPCPSEREAVSLDLNSYSYSCV